MIGLYFSGTGNSRYAARLLLQKLGCPEELYAIETEEAARQLKEHEEIVFAYPVQYSDVPMAVRDFVRGHAELWQGKQVFIIATMALFSGDGAGVLGRLLRRHGAVITGGLHLQMPDSIADEKVLKRSPEKNRRLVEAAGQKIAGAAEGIRAGRYPQQGLGFLSRMTGFLTQRLWFGHKTRAYTGRVKIAADRCIGCGKCARLCPTGNIAMKGKLAEAKERCTLCYRCVNLCPKQAVTLLGKNVIQQTTVEKYL